MLAAHVTRENWQHADLEAEVVVRLEERGWVVPPATTYGKVWSEQHQRMMERVEDATGLFVRGQADRVAVHPALGRSFQLEAKTSRLPNLACEVGPYLRHRLNTLLGVRCLYAFRNFSTGRDYGLWVTVEPWPIKEVVFCGRHEEAVGRLVRTLLPGVPVRKIARTNGGSGDPFIVIDRARADAYPTWREAIEEA